MYGEAPPVIVTFKLVLEPAQIDCVPEKTDDEAPLFTVTIADPLLLACAQPAASVTDTIV